MRRTRTANQLRPGTKFRVEDAEYEVLGQVPSGTLVKVKASAVTLVTADGDERTFTPSGSRIVISGGTEIERI